jgi:hypothetical protein
MLKRNCNPNISYAEMSGEEKFAFWEADYSTSSSSSQLPAPGPVPPPDARVAPEAPAPDVPAAPEALSPSSSSISSDTFISHFYVDTLLGFKEEIGNTSAKVFVKGKG